MRQFFHLENYTRQCHHPFPLILVGMSEGIPGRHTYGSLFLEISILLKGQGHYHVDGRRYELIAPCVFVKFPGKTIEMEFDGPVEEALFMYGQNSLNELEKQKLVSREEPVYYLMSASDVSSSIRDIIQKVTDLHRPYVYDLVDRMAAIMLVQAQSQKCYEPTNQEEIRIREIKAQVDAYFDTDLDINEIAEKQGLSSSNFRRLWRKHIGTSPHQYILQLRIERACSLLIETNDTIASISERVNFQDPFYFSKRFKKEVGVSPKEFRQEKGLSEYLNARLSPKVNIPKL